VNYNLLEFDRDELSSAMRETYEELLSFVSQSAFRSLHRELMALPAEERPRFVAEVIFSPGELARRGISVPDGILIQTSAFGDRRPTLFVVKKYLPAKFHGAWENVNITIFNEFDDNDCPRDHDLAWRPPLPVALQHSLLSRGEDLNSIPEEYGINYDRFVKAPAGPAEDQV